MADLLPLVLIYPPFLLFLPRLLAAQARKIPGIFDPIRIRISPAGLQVRGSVFDGDWAWSSVHALPATQEYLFLYWGEAHALIVPRRAFPSPTQAEAFIDAARRYWEHGKEVAPAPAVSGPVQLPTAPDGMTLSYELVEDDLVALQRHQFRRRVPLLLLWLAVLVYLVADTLKMGIAGGLILVVPAALLFGWMPSAVRKQVRKQSGLLGPQALAASPEGLTTWSAALGQEQRGWPGIREIRAGREHVYLFLNPMQAYVVPRRAFASTEESERFLARVREWHRAARTRSPGR
jgi:hypothetical protein